MNKQYDLPAGHQITVTALNETVTARLLEDPSIGSSFTTSATLGPYFLPRTVHVQGDASVVIAEADNSALLTNIPTTDQEDEATIWADADVLKVSGPAPPAPPP